MIDVARTLAEAFKKWDVGYLFIGKFAAMLYGYPGTTQDIDIYAEKGRSNGEKIISALGELGFVFDETLKEAILTGKDFIQIRGGPFPLDIVFAPDGIESFAEASKRGNLIEGLFACASMDDIINSKKAAGRQRDKEELPRLLLFKEALKAPHD